MGAQSMSLLAGAAAVAALAAALRLRARAVKRNRRPVGIVRWEPIPPRGTLVPVEEFYRGVRAGRFTDDGGYGCYAVVSATVGLLSNVPARPSAVRSHGVLQRFTHVVWFDISEEREKGGDA